MKTHNILQGSPQWLAHRATHLNASDAPAMMNCSPYKTRSQLLHELHTGMAPDVDPSTQRRFDDGHRFEALARPLAEEFIGETLYPVTGSEGKLSASFDGLTIAEDVAFEHKTLNAELRAIMAGDFTSFDLPQQYRVQMEHQCMVSGCEKVLFMASKWDGEDLVEELHCWYDPDPVLRQSIMQGWDQFSIDLETYKPSEVLPAVVATPVNGLPSVSVRMDGSLTVISNLPDFSTALLAFIERIPDKPSTDQEFADTEAACKSLKKAEEALEAAENNALSGMSSVEEMRRVVADCRELARSTRLAKEKEVDARKVQIRTEQVQRGKDAFNEHMAGLNTRLGKPYMPAVVADFPGVIKGKKTVASLKDAIDGELARCKIEANSVADRIQINLGTLRELAKDYAFLFADTPQVVLKAPDDLTMLVKSRIADHKVEVARKEEETRARIRAEEKDKLEREQREADEAEVALIASLWAESRRIERDSVPYILKAKATFETAAKDWENDTRPRVAAAVTEARAEIAAKLEAAQTRETAAAAKPPERDPDMDGLAFVQPAAQPMPLTVTVRQVVQPLFKSSTKPTTPPTLKLGQIGQRLGFALTGEFLGSLGFEPAARDKSALLFHEASFTLICAALVDHINSVQTRYWPVGH